MEKTDHEQSKFLKIADEMVINAIEKNKAGKEIGHCQMAGIGCSLKLSDQGSHQKVTCEQKPEEGEGASCVDSSGKNIPGREKSK